MHESQAPLSHQCNSVLFKYGSSAQDLDVLDVRGKQIWMHFFTKIIQEEGEDRRWLHEAQFVANHPVM